MPGNGSDGSIIIDTELDNEGFEKGSEKLLSCIAKCKQEISKQGEAIRASIQEMIPLLSTIAGAAASVNGEMERTATQTADANESVVESEQRVAQAAQQASGAVDKQGQGMSSLTSGANTAQGSMSALEREVNNLNLGMQAVSRSAETGFANGNAVLSFDAKLDEMERKLESAKSKLQAFGETKIPTKDYQWLTDNLGKAETAFEKLYERQIQMEDTGVKKNSQAWKDLTYKIQQTEAQVRDYKSEMTSMEEAGTAYTSGADTEEYARMQASIDGISADLARNRQLIDSEALAQARLNIQVAQEKLLRAQTTSQAQAAQSQLLQAQENLRRLAEESSLASRNTAPKESEVSGWKKFGDIIKNATSSAVKGIKNYVNNAKKATPSSNALVKSLTSLKRMLITRIKRMFISAIFNEVREGLKALAKYSAEFDRAMSNIKNSAKGVAGNLTVSLGNLISTIEPALTAVLNLLTSAISHFNAFYAAISGKSTVTVAKKQTASYAASLEDAADAAEDVKNQLMGFDKINKLNDDSSSSGSSGGVAFEDVPIESAIGSFFQKIKDSFMSGDWEGIGEIIADGLNSGMKKVDKWFTGTLRPLGKKWAKRIAKILNGLTDGFSWKSLGETIADGFNAVFDTIYTFLSTYNFFRLGEGLATSLNSWFEKTDFSLIGKTLGAKLRAAIDFGFGFVKTLNFKQIGQDIADAINGYLSQLSAINPETGLSGWQELGAGIAEAMNGIADMIKNAISAIEWDEVWQGIKDGFTAWWKKADWDVKLSLGVILTSLAINGVSKLLFGQGVLQLIASSLGKKISAAFAGKAAAETGAAVTEALGTEVAASAGTSTALATAGTTIGSVLIGAAIGMIVGEGIDKIIGSFDFDGNEYFKNFHWFGDDEYSFVGQLKNIWDNKDVLYDACFGEGTFFGNIGEYWGDAIWNGWTAVSSFFSTTLPETWESVKTTASTKWEDIKSAISTSWTNIKTDVSTAVDTLATTVSTKWGEIKTTASDKWADIKTSLTNTWSSMKDTVSKKWGEIKSTISTTWTNIKTSVSTTVGNIATTVSNKWNDIKSTASNKWNDIKSTISTKWSGLKDTLKSVDFGSIGSNLVSGLKKGITDAWDGLKTKVGDLCSGLTSFVKGIFDEHSPSKVWAEIGNYLGLGLEEGLDSSKRGVLNTTAQLAEAVTDEMAGAEIPTLQMSEDTVVTGLDRVADKLSGIAETFRYITSMLTAMGGLRVPQIAAGRVIPAKTRIDTTDTGTGEEGGSGLDMNALKRTLREVFQELGMDGDVVVPVSIDGDVIYQLVVKKNRRNTIKTGVNALG